MYFLTVLKVTSTFTVLLLTTSLSRAFQVVIILIGKKCLATDVLSLFTTSLAQLFFVLLLRHDRKSPLHWQW